MGEVTGYPSLAAFSIQQYGEILVEAHRARGPLKGKKCATKLVATITGQSSLIPRKSYFVE
jgi:hypothetical protein